MFFNLPHSYFFICIVSSSKPIDLITSKLYTVKELERITSEDVLEVEN